MQQIKRQQSVLRGTEQVTGHVDVMYKNPAKGQKVTKQENDMQLSECSRCGNVKKHSWKDCPARDAECRSCHKKRTLCKEMQISQKTISHKHMKRFRMRKVLPS